MDGSITLGGNITFTNDSVITWNRLSTMESNIGTANTNASSAVNNIKALASGTYTESGTTFISGKNIYSPQISGAAITGGTVTGGKFYSTGTTSTGSAYYVCQNNRNAIKGSLRYDDNGMGDQIREFFDQYEIGGSASVTINGVNYTWTRNDAILQDPKERVFLTTSSGVALKFESGGNMSFSAGTKNGTYGFGNGTIYFTSDVVFMAGVSGSISGGGGTTIAVFG